MAPETDAKDSPAYWFIRLEQARQSYQFDLAKHALAELYRLGIEIRFRSRRPSRRPARPEGPASA